MWRTLGARINSFFDEYGPIPSPTIQNRLYVTAARENSSGGFVTLQGEVNSKLGHPNPDIYFTDLVNGSWTGLQRLDSPINSPDEEHLLAFGLSGQSLYFRRGPDSGGKLLVDSFALEFQEYAPERVALNQLDDQIRDIFYFSDTIVLFRQHSTWRIWRIGPVFHSEARGAGGNRRSILGQQSTVFMMNAFHS